MNTQHAVEPEPPALGASFRDPSGFLFRKQGVLYRQINPSYQAEYDHFIQSGLYQRLVEDGLLIPHEEIPHEEVPHEAVELRPVGLQLAGPEKAYRILRPEKISFIAYPFEWCFSQYREAALATLSVQKIAFEYGMSLKDASAYNIQFHQGRPVLIDTLSFERYQEGRPWDAYRQFCQHFLAPLSLMARRDIRLGQLMRLYIDGLPLDLASGLLPARTRLSFPLLAHIHLHASAQKRYADKAVDVKDRPVSRTAFQGLVDNLESGVRSLAWSSAGTEWSDYYAGHNYTPSGLEQKRSLVGEYLQHIQPESVWDLGANTGYFSRVASDQGIPTVAFDVDPGAVEQNYLECRARGEKNLLPLLLDLTNPSPAIGWHNQERMSFAERGPAGAVLALALIHHLAISNNVPLHRLADFFYDLGDWLVIEFIPRSDPQVQRLLTTRKDIFQEYTQDHFEQAFSKRFSILRKMPIQDSERWLYLMKRE